MSLWCPQCGAEYVAGWRECSTCGVPLTTEAPPPDIEEPAVDYDPYDEDSGPSLARPREVEDPFVTIWEGPTPEGMSMVRLLEEAAIPVDTGEAAEPGRLRLEVPQSYVSEAYGVLDGASSVPVAIPDFNGSDPDAPLGWSPMARLAVAAVAVGLIIALILTSRF